MSTLGTYGQRNNVVRVVPGMALVNGKVAGPTKIMTFDNIGGSMFVPMSCNVRVVTQEGSITLLGTISVGTNSASYNNIMSSQGLTGLVVLNTLVTIPLTANRILIAPGSDVYANVPIAAIGTGTLFYAIDIVGYYVKV